MNGQRAGLGQVLTRVATGTTRLMLTSLTGRTGVTLVARERLRGRQEVIQKWTEQDKPAELASARRGR